MSNILTTSEHLKFLQKIVSNKLDDEYYPNCLQRVKIKTARELTIINQSNRKVPKNIKVNHRHRCYICCKTHRTCHGIYLICCKKCGDMCWEYRNYEEKFNNTEILREKEILGKRKRNSNSLPIKNRTAYVTGGRVKLGYQIALKLLRCGVKVLISTRNPDQTLYKDEPDYYQWKDNLFIYQESLNFNQQPSLLELDILKLENYIRNTLKWDNLDILINAAAQTIRDLGYKKNDEKMEKNRYNDSYRFPNDKPNSWSLTIDKVEADEFEEVMRVNAIAPALLVKNLRHLINKSEEPFIINVHAREGLFNVNKTNFHIHTNMAKAALHMFTLCNRGKNSIVPNAKICGVDPGWISLDEYYENSTPLPVPPLDEIDGAARILFPIWENRNCRKTYRHFNRIIS